MYNRNLRVSLICKELFYCSKIDSEFFTLLTLGIKDLMWGDLEPLEGPLSSCGSLVTTLFLIHAVRGPVGPRDIFLVLPFKCQNMIN